MNPIIGAVRAKVERLVDEGEELTSSLQQLGWRDDRPARTEPVHRDVLEDALFTAPTPAKARIPGGFVLRYHGWYASCLAIVEANMPSRREELRVVHEGNLRANNAGLSGLLELGEMTFSGQLGIASKLVQIQSIVGSVPSYLEGRLYDAELAVAQGYVTDQLGEAEILLKRHHVRAAGAVAGVLLERHLKVLCDRHQPPIKYTKKAGIAKLNEALRDATVYDVPQWRKVQWMGDIRNQSDHAGPVEPKKADVADLISEVRKFVALFGV